MRRFILPPILILSVLLLNSGAWADTALVVAALVAAGAIVVKYTFNGDMDLAIAGWSGTAGRPST